MSTKKNTIIESLGVYLPPDSYSTDDLVNGCELPIRFPLEKITGIKTRRMAGEHEFSIHLSINAVKACLEKSSYSAKDIDLVVCCNISRVDDKGKLTFEPSTSVRLKKEFGFDNALVFDISNACAGMFTGIYLVDRLLKAGTIKRGLVVSGEYITHLSLTAQREIQSFMDSKIACLTVGDAGAAVLLEEGSDNRVGFQALDLRTYGRYSPFCIAKEAERGGWIMLTDSVNLTDAGIKAGTQLAIATLEKADWSPASCDHLIMHQTSKLSLNSAKKEINQLLDGNYFHDENTINNLEHRGNTASTSHMVALADQIVAGNIQTGDKMVFSVTASGLTVGAGLYVFDDLPTRMNAEEPCEKGEHPTENSASAQLLTAKGVFIERVGIADPHESKLETLELLQSAALNCLAGSRYSPTDIELLIFCGVYRTEYTLEPAIAALLAGRLEMNATHTGNDERSTLAFDVFNGSVGWMNAVHLAQNMLVSGNFKTAMIVTAELENNAVNFPDELIGIRETGSAIILSYAPGEEKGLSAFEFSYNTDALDSYAIHSTYASTDPQIHFLNKQVSPNLETLFIESIVENVEQLLIKTGIQLDDLTLIIPPQISPEFIDRLSERMAFPRSKMIDVSVHGKDLFTSSVPYGFHAANAKPGDLGLLITVGSGIQVASALYHF